MKLLVLMAIGLALLAQSSARPQNKASDCSVFEVCIKVYTPVCAIDEEGVPRTFENFCELTRFNCNKETDYIPVKDGEC